MIGQFGVRSMNGKGIIYPYWENIAKGYEDILTALTLLMLITLLYPMILLLIAFIFWWRHKGWTLRDARLKGKDKLERLMERLREKRRSQKEGSQKEAGKPLTKGRSRKGKRKWGKESDWDIEEDL